MVADANVRGDSAMGEERKKKRKKKEKKKKKQKTEKREYFPPLCVKTMLF